MASLNLSDLTQYVNDNIVKYHDSKLSSLNSLELKRILSNKNPYLFKAKSMNSAYDLVNNILDAFLSSSEEKLFGDFLEDLAIYISSKTMGGHKSSATGIDLEFKNRGIVYIVSIKSGPNWGNSSQQLKQREDFNKAVTVLKQSRHSINIQPVLGICYGKTKTNILHG